MCEVPNIEPPYERIARAVYEPSFLYEDGTLSPSAFYMRMLKKGPEGYISVFWDTDCGILVNCMKSIPPREQEDSFCGYALLSTDAVEGISSVDVDHTINLDVRSHSGKRFPCHAGIHIRIDGEPQNAQHPYSSLLLMVMKDLQRIALFTRI